MYEPIHGSQVNPPARLYKRFMPTEPAAIAKTVIKFENKYYANTFAFAWAEADELTVSDERPIDGLVVKAQRRTIKFHGNYIPKPGSRYEPETGDVLEIDGEYWVIEDGISRKRIASLRNFATVTLPLKRLL